MEGMGLDLFATKGLEYILVIGYLLLLVSCRRMVGPRRSQLPESVEPTVGPPQSPSFDLQEGCHYHQGHAWAMHDYDGVMRVGVDDFAQQLLGPLIGVILPSIGSPVSQGEPAWKVRVGRRSIPVLSPVEGEVVAWNEEVLRSPELINSEPYEGGWIMKVRVRNPAAATRNLLSGHLAHAWMDEVVAQLDDLSLKRGGIAASGPDSAGTGLARWVEPGGWDRLAREFLLTSDEGDWSPYGAGAKHEAGQDQEAQLV